MIRPLSLSFSFLELEIPHLYRDVQSVNTESNLAAVKFSSTSPLSGLHKSGCPLASPRKPDKRGSAETMVLERLKQLASQVSNTLAPPHPLNPLSALEIETATSLLRKEHGQLFYNAVTLLEPPKAQMLKWLTDPEHSQRPARIADVVAITPEGKVMDGHVDLVECKVISWEHTPGVQPLITMEDLQVVEHVVRKNPKVLQIDDNNGEITYNF